MRAATRHVLMDNHILAALPSATQEQVLASVQRRVFAVGETLYDSATLLDAVYFPTSCIVSLVYTLESGVSTEIGLVGNEGVVGTARLVGSATVSHRAVVVRGGEALKGRIELLQKALQYDTVLQQRVLRYLHTLTMQISHTAVCNRFHSVEQRLCRWLLLCHDRAGVDELPMTHEVIATMVGGGRQSVTLAAGQLRDAGLIRYARGQIRIVNRRGLEAIACECYEGDKAVFDDYIRPPGGALWPVGPARRGVLTLSGAVRYCSGERDACP